METSPERPLIIIGDDSLDAVVTSIALAISNPRYINDYCVMPFLKKDTVSRDVEYYLNMFDIDWRTLGKV